MAGAEPAAKLSSGLLRALIPILILLAIALLILMPRLRMMMASARRMDQDTDSRMIEARQAASAHLIASSARDNAARNPKDPESHIRAAAALSQVGNVEQAGRHAEIAAQLAPGNIRAQLLLADFRRRQHRIHEAMEAFKAVLKEDPNNAPAIGGLASLYISLGWRKEAEALLTPAVRKNPNELPLKVAMALSAMQGDDFAGAEKLLLEVRAADSQNVRLWSPLVSLYNNQGRYGDTISTAGQILERVPGEIAVRNELGFAQFQLNRIPEAIQTFAEVLGADPENVMARYYTGLAFQRQGNIAAARDQLEKVYRVSPGFAQTRTVLGKLYLQAGKAEDGKALLKEAQEAAGRNQRRSRLGLYVSTTPEDPKGHFDLAVLYSQEKETQKAIAELHKALELDPAHAPARELLTALSK